MKVIRLSEPCYVQQPGEDVQHLPKEMCRNLFGWDSPCQAIEIFVRDEVPDVPFYAVVALEAFGIVLAASGELGIHHYFIPWHSVMAIHGHQMT